MAKHLIFFIFLAYSHNLISQDWTLHLDTAFNEKGQIISITEQTGIISIDTLYFEKENGEFGTQIRENKCEHGTFKYYFENTGTLQILGQKRYGHRVGTWSFFDSTGASIRSIDFSKWKTIDNNIHRDTLYGFDKMSPVAIYDFYLIPKNLNEGMGSEEFIFEETLDCLFEIPWSIINDTICRKKMQGELILFHPNGQIRAKGMFIDYKKAGKWNFYKEDGTFDHIKNYKRKKLLKARGSVLK